MSIEEIILNNWLNNNYKFEPKITDIQNDFKNGYKFGELLFKFELISNEDFKTAALLLLKCKVYDIEDKHYLETKKHSANEKENLKVYKKTIYPQSSTHTK